MYENWSDASAYVSFSEQGRQGVKLLCCEMFPPGEGPNLHILKKLKCPLLQTLAEQTAATVAQERRQLSAGEVIVDHETMATPSLKRKQAAAAKARVARAKTVAAKKTTRRVLLT